jgi:hypothetical protein
VGHRLAEKLEAPEANADALLQILQLLRAVGVWN